MSYLEAMEENKFQEKKSNKPKNSDLREFQSYFKEDMSAITEETDSPVYYPFENNGNESEARDENFCFSLKLFCCPKLELF